MTLKPCLVCGQPGRRNRCPEHLPKRPNKHLPRHHPHMNGGRWKRLSVAARRRQPWCLDCGAVADLTVDHVIPIAEAPELAYEPRNLAVRCRPCNSRRGARCTDAERDAVLEAITAPPTRGDALNGALHRRDAKARGALHTPGGYA
ncbi:MAG: HNH endonuclease [Actinobacteria bacterium]|nr:HNH endonuclease [Actinomycetota bacterium]